jgi:hypothetical protein
MSLRTHPVDLEGFEPSTSSVRLKRAPKLRYRPLLRVEKIVPESTMRVKTGVGFGLKYELQAIGFVTPAFGL